ncbi:uncharacterized protein LOC134206865 [Armigeres subalbatus]|uniref:uncharacterized protein LOC134206865 n=1 Tax=Armigeres subalbatus TaxID=124917 RepID=UPI002ED39998
MEIAKILHNIGIKNYKELKFAGQGRYRITFNRPREAEDLLNSKLLSEEFKYKVYVPNMLKESIGIIRNVPPSLTETEILNNIQTGGKKKIIKVERINRMKDQILIPTYTVKVYVTGQELPENVSIYGVPAIVEAYIFPIKMCNKCWRYGHRQIACKCRNERCENCGQEHGGQDCSNPTSCIHCKQMHKVTARNCPERIRQDKIRYVMANERLTFMEAANKFPKPNQVQNRLDSLTDFPPIITNDHNTRPKTRLQTSQSDNRPARQVSRTRNRSGSQNKHPQETQVDVPSILNKITAIQKPSSNTQKIQK